ncbi:putative membrane protein [Candidatus Saccharibacteria bacterium RAAC3_TM7_1]|nr:putative membrane protein [Candidatus Saccharibacteria bacterium RAAC3_TM7_1]
MKKQIKTSLRRYNIFAGFIHLAQGIAVLMLSKEFLLPVSGSFLQFNPTSQSLEQTTTTLFDVSLPWLIALFFFLSAVAHFSIASFYNRQYVRLLAQGINKARWIEYAISASVMMVAVSLLVGVYDFMSLVMIFSLVAIMNLMGLVMEVHNQTTKKTNWLSFWVGCLAGIIPWAVIAFYMWLGADQGAKAPDFVYWIFVSIFIFFNCFAVNMVLQYKKVGPWKNYLYGEFMYILLSLVAKSLLAWQVFAGTLRP